MEVLVVCALFAVAVQASVMVPSYMTPSSDEMINFINNLNTTWKAGRNFDKEVSVPCPTGLAGALRGSGLPLYNPKETPAHLPERYDARLSYPDCKVIRLIRDQGDCRACWAFGAVGAISDRICIHTKTRVQVNISAQDLVTCCANCGRNGNGCDAGDPKKAWEFYLNEGIVTGGLYGTKEGCSPYSFPPNNQQGLSPHKKGDPPKAPKCERSCKDGNNKTYAKEKHYAQEVYQLPNDEKKIMAEIFYRGPVEALFTIYSDFYAYKRGVYQRKSNLVCANHAVRLIGWGTENNVKFWLAANSWNVNWGMKGFFKIRRGTNECGIEDYVQAGIPKEP